MPAINAMGFDGNDVNGASIDARVLVKHVVMRMSKTNFDALNAAIEGATGVVMQPAGDLVPRWLFLGPVGGLVGFEPFDHDNDALTPDLEVPIYEMTLSFAYSGPRTVTIPGLGSVSVDGWRTVEPVYKLEYDDTLKIRYPKAVAYTTYKIYEESLTLWSVLDGLEVGLNADTATTFEDVWSGDRPASSLTP